MYVHTSQIKVFYIAVGQITRSYTVYKYYLKEFQNGKTVNGNELIYKTNTKNMFTLKFRMRLLDKDERKPVDIHH